MRMVSEEEGRQFAEKQNAHYCETSALSGKGIETVMSAIAECILQEEQRLLKQSLELGNSVFDLASPAASEGTETGGGAKGRGGGRGGGGNGKGCCAIL
uniref:Ras-related protein Rab-21 n=1 Tax=Globodera pallida TaxID=36090 RepID=A0A183BJ08_GLOPA